MKSINSCIALVVAIALLATPFLVNAQEAQQVDIAQAMAEGQNDAQAKVNSLLWMAIGCFGGVIGIVIAYVVEPSPSPVKLMGKRPEYITAYTQAYKDKGKSIQTSKSLIGCIVGQGVSTVCCVGYYLIAGACLFGSLGLEEL